MLSVQALKAEHTPPKAQQPVLHSLFRVQDTLNGRGVAKQKSPSDGVPMLVRETLFNVAPAPAGTVVEAAVELVMAVPPAPGWSILLVGASACVKNAEELLAT